MSVEEQIAQAKADLQKALEILKTDGWTQGVYRCKDGRYCVSGAIMAAIGVEEIAGTHFKPMEREQWMRHNNARQRLERHIPDDAIEWNDDGARTFNQVRDALLDATR